MENFPKDIYTEPTPDVNTLANLGPLTGMAGIWTGKRGLDINPKADGPEKQAFIEHMECQPIDAQTNGPQLFYGLRYHTRIVKPDDVETFHDQVGYWLWEPATGNIIQTLTIPRGQTAMATARPRPTPPASPQGRARLHRQRHLQQPVSGARLQNRRLYHHRHQALGRHLVVRAGNHVDGQSRPFAHTDLAQDWRAHAQPNGKGRS
jgi:hypothetical protein